MKRLSQRDQQRLSEELNLLPNWIGGIPGERSVLIAAGLSSNFVLSYYLTGTPTTDSINVIASLDALGHLETKPTHRALGALVEYLLNNTIHIEGKVFLAYVIEHYSLITDLSYLQELGDRYALPELPSTNLRDLGWGTRQPDWAWQGPADSGQLEAMWSRRAPFLDAVFLEKGARTARAVCCVESSLGSGSGFLIGPGLVLTNHHVVPADDMAREAQVRFGYRVDQTGQLRQGESFPVRRVVRRSIETELDYAVLEVEGAPGARPEIGYLRLSPKRLEVGRSLFIIQHPFGSPQKVVLQDNWITFVAADQRRVQYLTNTEHGSSGSPVCDENWDVVALHHSGRPLPDSPQTAQIRGNEGVPMAAILPQVQDLLA